MKFRAIDIPIMAAPSQQKVGLVVQVKRGSTCLLSTLKTFRMLQSLQEVFDCFDLDVAGEVVKADRPSGPWSSITELSICTTDRSYDGKTPNVASSPRRLSGPLRVVALGGPTEDKFDACAHEWNCYLIVAESIRRQIESSPLTCKRRWMCWHRSMPDM